MNKSFPGQMGKKVEASVPGRQKAWAAVWSQENIALAKNKSKGLDQDSSGRVSA
jgi:hypothetical protein